MKYPKPEDCADCHYKENFECTLVVRFILDDTVVECLDVKPRCAGQGALLIEMPIWAITRFTKERILKNG